MTLEDHIMSLLSDNDTLEFVVSDCEDGAEESITQAKDTDLFIDFTDVVSDSKDVLECSLRSDMCYTNPALEYLAKTYNYSDEEVFYLLTWANKITSPDCTSVNLLTPAEYLVADRLTGKASNYRTPATLVMCPAEVRLVTSTLSAFPAHQGLEALSLADFNENSVFSFLSFSMFLRLSTPAQMIILYSLLTYKRQVNEGLEGLDVMKGSELFHQINIIEQTISGIDKLNNEQKYAMFVEDMISKLERLPEESKSSVIKEMLEQRRTTQAQNNKQQEPVEGTRPETKQYQQRAADLTEGFGLYYTKFAWQYAKVKTQELNLDNSAEVLSKSGFGVYSYLGVVARVNCLIRYMQQIQSRRYLVVADDHTYFTHQHSLFKSCEELMKVTGLVTHKKFFLAEVEHFKQVMTSTNFNLTEFVDFSPFTPLVTDQHMREFWAAYQTLVKRVDAWTKIINSPSFKFDNLTIEEFLTKQGSFSIECDDVCHSKKQLHNATRLFETSFLTAFIEVGEACQKLQLKWTKTKLAEFLDTNYLFFETLRRHGYDPSRSIDLGLLEKNVGMKINPNDVKRTQKKHLTKKILGGKVFASPPLIFSGPPTSPFTTNCKKWKDCMHRLEHPRFAEVTDSQMVEFSTPSYGCYDNSPFMMFDKLRAFSERVKSLIHFCSAVQQDINKVSCFLKNSKQPFKKPIFLYYDTAELAKFHENFDEQNPNALNGFSAAIPLTELADGLKDVTCDSDTPIIPVNRIINQYFEMVDSKIGPKINQLGYNLPPAHQAALTEMMTVIMNCPLIFATTEKLKVTPKTIDGLNPDYTRGTDDRLARLLKEYQKFGYDGRDRMVIWNVLLGAVKLNYHFDEIFKRFCRPYRFMAKYKELLMQEKGFSRQDSKLPLYSWHGNGFFSDTYPCIVPSLFCTKYSCQHSREPKTTEQQAASWHEETVAGSMRQVLKCTSRVSSAALKAGHKTPSTHSRDVLVKLLSFPTSGLQPNNPSIDSTDLTPNEDLINIRIIYEAGATVDPVLFTKSYASYQIFNLVDVIYALPVTTQESCLSAQQQSLYNKNFLPQGQHMDDHAFAAELCLDLDLLLLKLIQETHSSITSEGSFDQSKTNTKEPVKLVIDGKLLYIPRFEKLVKVNPALEDELCSLIEWIICNCNELMTNVSQRRSFLKHPSAPRIMTEWSTAISSFAINTSLIVRRITGCMQKIKHLLDISHPVVHDFSRVFMTLKRIFGLLKIIDVYYRRGLPDRCVVQPCGPIISKEFKNQDTFSDPFLNFNRNKILKEGCKDWEPKNDDCLKTYTERCTEAFYLLSLSNPSLKSRVVTLKGVVGHKGLCQLMYHNEKVDTDKSSLAILHALQEYPCITFHSLRLNNLRENLNPNGARSVVNTVKSKEFQEDYSIIKTFNLLLSKQDKTRICSLVDVDVTYTNSTHFSGVIDENPSENIPFFTKFYAFKSEALDFISEESHISSLVGEGYTNTSLTGQSLKSMYADLKGWPVAHTKNQLTNDACSLFIGREGPNKIFNFAPEKQQRLWLKYAKMLQHAGHPRVNGGNILRHIYAIRVEQERAMFSVQKAVLFDNITELNFLAYSGFQKHTVHDFFEALKHKLEQGQEVMTGYSNMSDDDE